MSLKKKKTNNLDTQSWAEVTRLYHKLADLEPLARVAVLREATKGNDALRAEVEFLLQNSADLDGFLETPIAPKAAREFLLRPEPEEDVLKPGDRTGDFVIVRPLGSGSFATVYLARQISLDREIALKVSADIGEEAKTMAHLEHDNIVKVYSETVDKGRSLRFICMQYVPGVSLDTLMERLHSLPPEQLSGQAILDALIELADGFSTLDPGLLKERDKLADLDFPEACLWMATKLAEALAYAHERGVLHLDVKPSNIIVSVYGRPMLTDFNVSLDARGGREKMPSNFGGTFTYMSPEQQEVFHSKDRLAAVGRIDQRADIFSLGIVISELLGKFPLDEETRIVLGRALDPEPSHRFPSAKIFAEALEGCDELYGIMKGTPPVDGLLAKCAKRPLIALTFVGALPQLVASAIGISYNSIRIVRHLSEAQQGLFQDLNLYYLPFIYGIATVVWIKVVSELAPYLKNRGAYFEDQEKIAALRRHTLRLPLWGIAATTFGWIPASIIFPTVLHLKAGPLPIQVAGHFLLSFNLSWMIAMAYSFLLHQIIVVRVLYPRFFMGAVDIKRTARAELSFLPTLLRASTYLAGLIPLLGAALLLQVGPDMFDDQSYKSFQMLVTCLIGLGVAGIFFTFSAGQKLANALFSLTGNVLKSKK